MKRMRAFLLVVFLNAAVAAPLFAQTSVDFAGRYWIPDMSGRMRVVEQGGFGTDIDMRGDLGFSDTNFAQGAVTLRHGRSQLTFRYTPIEYAGDQTVSRTIEFSGRLYMVGTRVVSDLEVKHLQLSWSYQFINVKDGALRLGPMVEANGFLMRGRLAAPEFNVVEEEELSAGLPTVGMAMNIQPHRAVNLYGEVAGLNVGDYGYFIGSEAGAKVRAWHVLFTAGYRTFNLHVKDRPDFARLRLNGPFVGAGFSF
jgi:hypothetical protein